MNDRDEERYVYAGPGALPGAEGADGAPLPLVLFHVDAVLPRVTANPALTRAEYDLVERLGGWERSANYWGLLGWEARLREKCRGFHGGMALGHRKDEERIQAVVAALDEYRLSFQTGYAYILGDSEDLPCDRITFAIQDAVELVRAANQTVRDVTVYLPDDPDLPGLDRDVASRLAFREPTIDFDLRPTHPVLGLLSDRLPLPPELVHLDRELERRVPDVLKEGGSTRPTPARTR
jgi:hypothetical protein